jgi:peptidoglycan hydrolase-like protein with peptidoglycan-binding domain
MKSSARISLLVGLMFMLSIPTGAQQVSGRNSIDDLDMSAVSRIGSSGIRIVQTLLRKRAMRPGPIDGIYGPKTTAAIRAFQSRYGMAPSGKINNQLLFALGRPDLAQNSPR